MPSFLNSIVLTLALMGSFAASRNLQDDDDLPELCPDCSMYGGIVNSEATFLTGSSCNTAFFASIFFKEEDRCDEFAMLNTQSCCANPPAPACPICGSGAIMNPDRVIPGTGMTCRNIQASIELDPSNCQLLKVIIGRFCCMEEPAAPDSYCQACPENDALPWVELADGTSCTEVILTNMAASTSACPDVSGLGCCKERPAMCGANSTCADPSTFAADRVVTPLAAFSPMSPPTCGEVLDALSLAGDCSTASEVGLPLGCCDGAEECFLCMEGGEIDDPARTLDILEPGMTCGTANDFGRFFPAENCTMETFGFDLDGYCGCPAGREPMNLCGDLCGSDSVPDPSRPVLDGESTCGEMEALLPWAITDDFCESFSLLNSTCCVDLSPTAAPSNNVTMEPSMAPMPETSAAPWNSLLFGAFVLGCALMI